MFKSILAVLGGLAVGVFTIGLVEYLGHSLYTSPTNLSQQTSETDVTPDTASVGVLLLVLFAYALGSFFGGMVASRYAPGKPVLHALVVGGFLLASGIANVMANPHPVWFMVVSLLIFLPMAFFGGVMASKRIP